MNYNELRTLCMWLKKMEVQTCGQYEKLVKKFNLDTNEKIFDFANGCACWDLTYSDLIHEGE